MNYFELEKKAKENLLEVENEKSFELIEELLYKPNTNFRENFFKTSFSSNQKVLQLTEKKDRFDTLPCQWQTQSNFNPFLYPEKVNNFTETKRKPFENNSKSKISLILRNLHRKSSINKKITNEKKTMCKTHRKTMSTLTINNQNKKKDKKDVSFFNPEQFEQKNNKNITFNLIPIFQKKNINEIEKQKLKIEKNQIYLEKKQNFIEKDFDKSYKSFKYNRKYPFFVLLQKSIKKREDNNSIHSKETSILEELKQKGIDVIELSKKPIDFLIEKPFATTKREVSLPKKNNFQIKKNENEKIVENSLKFWAQKSQKNFNVAKTYKLKKIINNPLEKIKL